MARAAVIPPASPPKRATRGRGKGTTTSRATSKQATKVTKNTAAESKRRTARTARVPVDSESEGETDDEIGVIESKGRGKTMTSSGRGKSTASSTKTGRGRRAAAAAAATEGESESENDDDELAQADAPKKRAGRPKANNKDKAVKEQGATKAGTATSKPRGRPRGTTTKAAASSEDDILKENTRINARLHDGEDFGSSRQGLSEIFITTNSAILRGPAKKKKVTFQELFDSDEEEELNEPAPATRRRKGTAVAKEQEGLAAKPVRRTATGATRGRKPAAAKKGAKPLSPKKATQVAKGLSSYASSDGEDDELSGAKDAIKLVVHSPQKQASGNNGLGSPVRRINFTPIKATRALDENGDPALPPQKAFDFGDSIFMSSPARRPPPSPFHFTMKETPKRAELSFRESTKSLTRPDAPPAQNSPLRTSPKKANLGTPGRGSLFLREDHGISQPNFTPAQNSPLKLSPKKGIFGASFAQQQPAEQTSTPFKRSLLMSPARKVVTPFKGSINHAPSSLAKETRIQESESDDETVSMYDDSPSRGQSLGNTVGRETSVGVDGQAQDSPITQRNEYVEEEEAVQSDGAPVEGEEEEVFAEDVHISLPEVNIPVEEAELRLDELEENNRDDEMEAPLNVESHEVDNDDEEAESPTPKGDYDVETERDEYHEQDTVEQYHVTDVQEDSDMDETPAPASTTYRNGLFNGLEDVFTEKSPTPEVYEKDNPMPDVDDEEDTLSGNDSVNHDTSAPREDENEIDEPTLIDEVPPVDLVAGPVQPYEVEEVENTPFVNFLLTYWAPTLQCVDECESTLFPAVETQDHSVLVAEQENQVVGPEDDPVQPEDEYAEPEEEPAEPGDEPVLPDDQDDRPRVAEEYLEFDAGDVLTGEEPVEQEEERDDVPDHSVPPASHLEQNTPSGEKEEPQVPSLSGRGPRFTLLAEQLSQWKASSPAKEEASRPRRRGVFSLAGRSSNVSSNTPRARSTDIFANAPSLVPVSRPWDGERVSPELEIHEDKEIDFDEGKNMFENSPRQPMAEIAPDEMPVEKDAETKEGQAEFNEAVNYPPLELPDDQKENESLGLQVPATPAKNPPLNTQTFHTVSKVPLKPEGEISPLKFNRKRGRSLSITSPVRSSPRLQSFVLPPTEQGDPESPRKSRRLQHGSTRNSLSKPVGASQAPRPRTPSRSASPTKSPQKQVSAYSNCLRGAIVYVDVHTTEGEDASGIFIEVLTQMGARCIKNWSWNPRLSVPPDEMPSSTESRVGITHVVFKDGGVRTLEKVRQARGVVKCVGVGWVLDCERQNKWLDEAPYAVDSSIIPRGGAKRRKSMEPRALSNINGTLIKTDANTPNRRPSAPARNIVRSTTPLSGDDRSTSTPEDTREYEPSHTEVDQRYWQTPRTPSAAALGLNLDSIGMSPATPFYLSQRSRLVQQTCPPKQTRQGLFSKSSPEEPSQKLKARLEAARRKSLAFKPAIGSPLIE
ncbi:hypothetical protein BJX61DRAFT_545225 [Aspergillus egyptiacus]|nr:hypothetical protein BJX61DRAFT_545225 [Aspergillus egyptiacus]